MPPRPPSTVRVLYTRPPKQPDELPLLVGRILHDIRATDDDGWWSGIDGFSGVRGVFPSDTVVGVEVDVDVDVDHHKATSRSKQESDKRVNKTKTIPLREDGPLSKSNSSASPSFHSALAHLSSAAALELHDGTGTQHVSRTPQGCQSHAKGQTPSTPTRLTLRQYNHNNHYYTVNNAAVHHVTTNTNNTVSHKQQHHSTSSIVDNKSATQNNNNTSNVNTSTNTSTSNVSTVSTSANTTTTNTNNTNNETHTRSVAASLIRRTLRFLIYATWRSLTTYFSCLFRLIFVPLWLVPALSSLFAVLILLLILITVLTVLCSSSLLSASAVASWPFWLLQHVLRRWASWIGGCIGYLWRSLLGHAPEPPPPPFSSTSAVASSTAPAIAATLWAWIPFTYAFRNPSSTTTVSSSSTTATSTPPNDDSGVCEQDIDNFLWDTWYIRKGSIHLAAQPVLDKTLQQAQNRVDKLKQSVEIILRSDSNKENTFLTAILPTLDKISASFSLAQAAVGPAIERHRRIEDGLIDMVSADYAAALHLNRQVLYRNASAEATRRQRLLSPSSSRLQFLFAILMRIMEHIHYGVLHTLSYAGLVAPPLPPLPTPPPVTPLSVVVDRLNQWEMIVQIAEARRELLLRGNSGLLNEFRLNDHVGSATCMAYYEIHQSLVHCGGETDRQHAQAQHDGGSEGGGGAKTNTGSQKQQSTEEVLRKEASLFTAMSSEQWSWLEMLDALGQFTCAWGDEFVEWQRDKGARVENELRFLRDANEQRRGLMLSLKAGREDGEAYAYASAGKSIDEQDEKIVGVVEAILMRETRAWLDLLHRHWEDLDEIQ